MVHGRLKAHVVASCPAAGDGFCLQFVRNFEASKAEDDGDGEDDGGGDGSAFWDEGIPEAEQTYGMARPQFLTF